jgi:hypothetical protein
VSSIKDAIYATCRDCGRDQRRIVGRGLCGGCYDRHWQAKTLDQFPRLTRPPKPIPAEKACAICKVVQPLENFAQNNRRPDGRGSYCKPCAREKYHRPWVEQRRSVDRPTEGEQKCRKCGEVKPYSEFYWEADKGRYRYRCKACHLVQSKRRWERTGGRNQRVNSLKHKFGLTEEQYFELLAEQGGGCAICGRTPEELGKTLPVDHCHTNGHVRGILCSPCNTGIGMFGDNVVRLQAAIEYLKNDEMRE